MVISAIIATKVAAIEHHVARIFEKRHVDLDSFYRDLDRQESVLFNFQMAIQNCIDIASHIVAEEDLGVAGSTNELFYLLEEAGMIDAALTEKLVRAVGFRNVIVHEYGKVDLQVVFRAAWENIQDLKDFARVILERFG